MERRQDIGVCEHCGREFGYYLVHNGFNDSSYAYCDACGVTAIFSLWTVPKGIPLKPHQIITSEIEGYITPCRCSGDFRSSAVPRCPHCHEILSPVLATDYIERQAEGAKKGWRWQRTWTGLYCVIIENKVVSDCWKSSAPNIVTGKEE